MGRSQVERNRARGRPGSKGGRGMGGKGGGRNDSDSTSSNTITSTSRAKSTGTSTLLGSNSFRYERKRSSSFKANVDNDDDGDDNSLGEGNGHNRTEQSTSTSLDYLVGGNEHGASHYSVAANFYDDDDRTDGDRFNRDVQVSSVAIDVKLLSKCLSEGDKELNYLRFDERMRDMFRNRFHGGGSTNETKMTVAEMRVLPGAGDVHDGEDGIEEEKVGEILTKEREDEKGDENNVSTPVSIGEDDNDRHSCDDKDDEAENLEDWLDDMIL